MTKKDSNVIYAETSAWKGLLSSLFEGCDEWGSQIPDRDVSRLIPQLPARSPQGSVLWNCLGEGAPLRVTLLPRTPGLLSVHVGYRSLALCPNSGQPWRYLAYRTPHKVSQDSRGDCTEAWSVSLPNSCHRCGLQEHPLREALCVSVHLRVSLPADPGLSPRELWFSLQFPEDTRVMWLSADQWEVSRVEQPRGLSGVFSMWEVV